MWELLVRAAAGGTIVTLFALVGEVVSPKKFAGVFGAAPSVAVASLAVTIASGSGGELADAGVGMIGGGLAMVAYCVAAARCVERFRAVAGSTVAWIAWLAVALGWYGLVAP